MGRKKKLGVVAEDAVELGCTPSPNSTMIAAQPSAPTALLDLAEELGKLLARRELGLPNRRRGYSLPEIILGAAVTCLISILAFKVWMLFLR